MLAPSAENQARALAKRLDALSAGERRALAEMPAIKARLGATFVPTPRQIEAERLLDGPATHILLWGGARSGKTHLLCRHIVSRALRAAGSRHLIARYRFNHVIQSVWHDTMPKVMATCFPGVEAKKDKASWFWELPNKSQIWFGGLDDKERTEKVLGNEYATVLLNECSQIGLAARNTVVTRLAQNCGLPLKAFYDENPPVSTHWTHRLFLERREATPPYAPLANPEAYAHLQMNPADNAANLPASYLAELQALPARERLRFWDGRFGDVGENALWSFEVIETYRRSVSPDLRRIVVAVDPSGTKGDDGGDTVGIVVVGLGLDGEAYLLEDASTKAPPSMWGRVVVNCVDRHDADCVVAETNYGGAMVEAVVRAAAAHANLPVRIKEVRATRGKVVRAEPIAALYEQGKVHHVGAFPALEDQLVAFTTGGYMGDGSPDRADALIWGLTEFFPRVASRAESRSRSSPEVILGYANAKRMYGRHYRST
ncbi:MAG TPA: phage terminase large subunit [Hyphomicrobiaceae bacterium]|nr:phage terminase large subunit [Hyphomicrobiaceae bacterium]